MQNLPKKTILKAVVLSPLLLLFLLQTSASAQSTIELPAGFTYQTVVNKLDGPTSFALAPDGRIFITQKAGAVKVFHNDALLRENFIDLSSQVNQHADRGLMSVAVHPNFPATPYVYFAYVYEPPQAAGSPRSGGRVSRVLRVSADPANPNRHQPGTEVVLLGKNSVFEQIGNPNQPEEPPFSCTNPDGTFAQDCLPAEGTAHVVNHLIFGRDGSLFVSNGDGTVNQNANIRAQQIDSLAGKILRIDPISGQGYADNPFFDGNPDSNRSKVYALGLRNPFRIAQNPQTGALMVAEVGNQTWEELSLAPAGANLGWPCFEGPDRASLDPACDRLFNGSVPATSATYQYRHTGGFGAAIGGDFYTANQFPTQYQGAYFFSDYPASVIQYLTFSPSGEATVNDFASNAWKIVQMQAGADGSLYLISIGSGELGRISYPTGRTNPPPPIAARQPQPTLQPASEPTSQPTSQPTTRPLRVVIQRTNQSVARSSIRNVPPQAIIIEPAQNITADIGTTIMLKGEGRDELGTLPPASLAWEATLQHKDHTHYDFFNDSGAETSFTFADHGDNTYIELCLTATDPGGLTGSSCVDIRPTEVTYTFQSEPPGIDLLYDGTRYTTPFRVNTYVGAQRFIGAPANPSAELTFNGWSTQNQPQSQSQRQQRITIQPTNQTITARYTGENNARQGTGVTDSFTSTQSSAQPIPLVNPELPAQDVATATQETVPAATGSILREWWGDIEGKTVADLVSSSAFPNRPSGSELLTKLQGPAPFADNYGTRISGYLHPPVSGQYFFWIASDDNSQLWLSTDDKPANKVQIARVTHWTPRQKWYENAEQASTEIYLEAGKKYYIEVLHKEAAQKDNVAVAWQIPGGSVEVIDGQYLSPPRQ